MIVRYFAWLATALMLFSQTVFAQTPLRLDADELKNIQQAWQAGQAPYKAAVDAVLANAERLLLVSAPTVTIEINGLPKKSINDYVSLAPYWWPNPDTKDGLPWVKQDGRRNPWVDEPRAPKAQWNKFAASVEILALAYFYSQDQRFAEQAATFIKVWMLNPATRMNPHLSYSQAVPGVAEGRSYGIIDTVLIPQVIDAFRMVSDTGYFSVAERAGVNQWFTDFYHWLNTSNLGVEERRAYNNHGTFYDLQVLALALHLGNIPAAEAIVSSVQERLSKQISVTGAQPHELTRTRPYWYSVYNLRAFTGIAALAKNLKRDLWLYPDAENAHMLKALNYILSRRGDISWGGSEELNLEWSALTMTVLEAPIPLQDWQLPMSESCFARAFSMQAVTFEKLVPTTTCNY